MNNDQFPLPIRHTGTLIIGSGAASLSCAIHLKRMAYDQVLVVTDNRNGGTSRNTGSDKQTYYRLGDASPIPDSPYQMVESYLHGGSVHGDIAFIEAQNSNRAFYNLVSLGVPFPYNSYGGFTGYKTDHDQSSRGVSLGPYTSREMVLYLNAEVDRLRIEVQDHTDVIKLLVSDDNRAVGAVVLDKTDTDGLNFGMSVILADHVVLGTGGPAGFYAASVYPKVHIGSIGLAFEIGAQAVNLTESQFGIGSIQFRWNLSGSYQQVMPRYVSYDKNMENPSDFLVPYFDSWDELSSAVFLKGYQWPFDAAKVPNHGSSLVDLLVYQETRVKGRRVFLDYRSNMQGKLSWGEFSKRNANATALGYLEASKAWAETPYERLAMLNQPAIDLYRKHGIDLSKDLLEIDVCAQHNNGGLYADLWWESTNIKHLYPIGEVNGSHGVSRPGGSALNAGQVGALRAATRIVGYGVHSSLNMDSGLQTIANQVQEVLEMAKEWTGKPKAKASGRAVLENGLLELRQRMSKAGGPIRSLDLVCQAYEEAEEQDKTALVNVHIDRIFLAKAFRLRHMLIAQKWYLFAIKEYLMMNGGSRGSYLVVDPEGTSPHPGLEEYKIKVENKALQKSVQVVSLLDGKLSAKCEACRGIPTQSFWFERVWADFKKQSFFTVH